MQPFSPEERSAIAEAIARAEAQTSGEIVVVAARSSSRYLAYGLMLGAFAALLMPWPLIEFTKWPVEYIYLLQLAAFALCALLLQWEALRFALVPASIKRARAHRRAIEQFVVQNLYTTRGRTGVLIYVSFAERFAEVIADEAIYKKVDPNVWQHIIADLTHHLGQGVRKEGFVYAIDSCGKVLAEHFPPGRADRNELSNHLIVLDAP